MDNSNGITINEHNYKDFIGKKVLVIEANVVLTPETPGKPAQDQGTESSSTSGKYENMKISYLAFDVL